VLPNTTLLADAIRSGKVGAWSLIQNGLGVEEDLYEAVKGTPIVSSLAWIGIMTSPDGETVRWRGVVSLTIEARNDRGYG
jgi:2-dehydropantoate 2-reductase